MERKAGGGDRLSGGVPPGSGSATDNLLAEALRKRGWDVAVAESCTGGLLGGRITSLPGSSDYFAGGVIAYSNQLKTRLLEVPEELIEAHGAVSREVAMAMVTGLVRVTGTAAGLAITGVAGPAGSGTKPPGTVFVAVTCPAGAQCVQLRLDGDREEVRAQAVSEALALLLNWAEDQG